MKKNIGMIIFCFLTAGTWEDITHNDYHLWDSWQWWVIYLPLSLVLFSSVEYLLKEQSKRE